MKVDSFRLTMWLMFEQIVGFMLDCNGNSSMVFDCCGAWFESKRCYIFLKGFLSVQMSVTFLEYEE